jgi:hypothetical protein
VDQHGQLIQTIYPNESGIGSFMLTPNFGERYYLVDLEEQEERLPLPEVASGGISINVANERDRSLQISIIQKPSLPMDIFVLTAFRGKVSGMLQTKLTAQTNTIEIPVQYLRPGINDIVIIDIGGNTLVERQIFQAHESINIEIASTRWKSKRSNRLELTLKASNKNGAPMQANLSAIQQTGIAWDKCDIRNEVLLQEVPWRKQINFDLAGDSLNQVIDNLLLLGSAAIGPPDHTSKVQGLELSDDLTSEITSASVFAEVSVSSSFYSQNSRSKKMRKKIEENSSNDIFWIPKLNIDEQGTAKIELKVPNKNQSIMINIQGLSDDGSIGNQMLVLDPSTIKADRKSGKK